MEKQSLWVDFAPEDVKKMREAQIREITEYEIYMKLARFHRNATNREVFERIAQEEKEHYEFWTNILGTPQKPKRILVWFYLIITRLFGITFGVKLMEKGEEAAEKAYRELLPKFPQVQELIDSEDQHEQHLISLLDEERLKYVSSMVLGLNDALVELTGALAGLTLALQKTSLVALAGIITGIAAAMSMSASEYLSTKAEEEMAGEKSPGKAAVYTGIAYIFTVMFLVYPYLIFSNPFFCLALTVVDALIVILFFTYYISVAKDLSFKTRFVEMAIISLGIALINFGIGFGIRRLLNIEV